jgi:hypothetical protein
MRERLKNDASKNSCKAAKQSARTFPAEHVIDGVGALHIFVIARPISVEQASSHEDVMCITGLCAIH